jgi:hypothetical protein
VEVLLDAWRPINRVAGFMIEQLSYKLRGVTLPGKTEVMLNAADGIASYALTT